MTEPPLLTSFHSTTLAIPPSCIEFVPGSAEWVVIGTYFLDRSADEVADGVNEDGGECGDEEGKKIQKRSGSLVLARLEGRKITITSSHPTPFAIFDLHFSPHTATVTNTTSSSSRLLGLASSTGSIALYAIDPLSATAPITHMQTLQLFPTSSLFTYFSWHPTIPLLVAAALADGRVVLCDCSGGDGEDEERRVVTLHEHSLEAWVTSFAPDGTALFSGGDDATLMGAGLPVFTSVMQSGGGLSPSAYLAALSSKRQGSEEEGGGDEDDADGGEEAGQDEDEKTFTPPWQWHDARTHGAGVTFILPLHSPSPSLKPQLQQPTNGPVPPTNLLLTGSYDESLRLLQPLAPNGLGPRRSRILADIALGGGVWRISVVDSTFNATDAASHETQEGKVTATVSWVLIVSCMHAGTRIVRLTGTATLSSEWAWGFEVLARFEEHQSMNYGSVVQPLVQGEGGAKRTVVSTSFYDRLVCAWEW